MCLKTIVKGGLQPLFMFIEGGVIFLDLGGHNLSHKARSSSQSQSPVSLFSQGICTRIQTSPMALSELPPMMSSPFSVPWKQEELNDLQSFVRSGCWAPKSSACNLSMQMPSLKQLLTSIQRNSSFSTVLPPPSIHQIFSISRSECCQCLLILVRLG
jgi:hypothetical protein